MANMQPINRSRRYRNTYINNRNQLGMYSALVLVTPVQYVQVAADTLVGMRRIIRETLAEHGRKRAY